MSNVIDYQIKQGIARVTLNRPDKMNALNLDLFKALAATGEAIKSDTRVRVVVLSGAGKAFCAGLDMELMMSGGAPDLLERSHGVCNLFQQAAWVWHEVPVPVIAAVHGSCLGGGLQVMCGADMRYIHPQTKLSIMEMKWGIVPDMAGTQLWGAYVREDIIRELTYSARVFTGEEAERYGFATRLCEDPLADAMETAAQIAHKNPDAIRAAKRLINNQRQPDIAAGILAESVEQDALMGKPNQIEAVTANFEKRAPRFIDPQ
ncbi:crotonase/enoyl-CoA hydratase family protein [Oceanicoccus sagamiensis]|uniref:Enoyl-CoA hydratase n=1 Tax=Oceanicoccus sagamiensis TaxID=716816 RepID=A0A1X9N3D7_9GAMM|nr:crotonase/enoyl-CoA hydratase family protein [Oceanicoccus sagamiensis]ARN72720.1 enoyl-CoA hydratase [Oceanicoccus sagamiensis]